MENGEKIVPAQYMQIALDIAGRIASGELAEGSKLYGRSVMASEYSVSPETIRRALRLLADMKVVETKPQSATTVLSGDNAKRYMQSFSGSTDRKALRAELKELMKGYTELTCKMEKVVSALVRAQETYACAQEPLPNYEILIPQDSPHIGKNIAALRFWQATGGTIIAIRRGREVILSPGPYAELYGGDTIIIVGTLTAAEAATKFVSVGKEETR